MRIAVAQLDPVVGAFDSNVAKIKEAYLRACAERARLLLTPELGVCGYPPHDLIERPEMFDRNEKAVRELTSLTVGQECALVVGYVAPNPSGHGRAAQNVVAVLEKGTVVFRQAKTLLPTYDVFDEARYFEPAQDTHLWECDGRKIALAICEDLWADDPAFGRKLYGTDPMGRYRSLGAELVISISASPYEYGKRSRREDLHANVARALGTPLIYVNQVGATDEILFDGGSFLLDAGGKFMGRLPLFRSAFGIVEVFEAPRAAQWDSPPAKEREDQEPPELEILSRALVTGIREYFSRTGFKTAVIGLSGGIDSAVVATLASRALGPRNVLGVAMPSQYSSSHSLEDAETLARKLGMPFEVRPIKFLFSAASRELAERRGELHPIALENLQSRLRGMILMTLANHYEALVLTTGNKSEMATGYCTLYGDMVGALAPIGDVLKTRVYELAHYLNQTWGEPIPSSSVSKAPSAELRPGQTDQDSLPPYEHLDRLLEDYIEKGTPVEELERDYGAVSWKGASVGTGEAGESENARASWVRQTLRRLEVNEYKRRQSAPVLKISHKAFGIGRRIPIAKTWDQ